MSATAAVSVRPAVPGDAAAIAGVQRRTWRAAYAELLPPAALELSESDLAEAWAPALRPASGGRVLVALEGAAVVGVAACSPADGDDEPGAGELGVLLVEPRWGRRGHGSRLMAAAVDLWREDGTGVVLTWVFEDDAVVAGFLEPTGWAPDAVGRTLEAEGRVVRQRRWRTTL